LSVNVNVPDVIDNGELVEGELVMTNLCDEWFGQSRGHHTFQIYRGDEPLLEPYPIPDYLGEIDLAPGESYLATLSFKANGVEG